MTVQQYIDYYTFKELTARLALDIKLRFDNKIPYKGLVPIPNGGNMVAVDLAERLKLPIVTIQEKSTQELSTSKNYLWVDDLVDSGKTWESFGKPDLAVLHVKPHSPRPDFWVQELDAWIVYWWEGDNQGSIQSNITRLLEFIGEDPTREGLIETPNRMVRSWEELYAGYKKDPSDLFTTFEPDGYDQIVLLKNIELYSNCEHHMLPFYGKAHVAYIPNGRVLGVSKLARLVDLFARRLQIQERIGEQVTSTLMDYLHPKGAACIIEADHMCMRMRGCRKQGSTMVTSSLKGVFLEDSIKGSAARAELMGLIK